MSCLPDAHPSRKYFTLTVKWRGGDRWSVHDMFGCLSLRGVWDTEPSSSVRTERWEAQHFMDLASALALAKRIAPQMTLPDGRTVVDVLRGDAGLPRRRGVRR